ncbi:hypothetical protein, partial [Burkholderia dolosa]|uniref:hypothetical protein n=1 Tax=Burkholderia dolosa TaxID=152500 RepID=UPI001C972F50
RPPGRAPPVWGHPRRGGAPTVAATRRFNPPRIGGGGGARAAFAATPPLSRGPIGNAAAPTRRALVSRHRDIRVERRSPPIPP